MSLLGLFRAIVEDPERTTFWKIFDVTLLVILWTGSVILVFATFANGDWQPLGVIWWSVTAIASVRSWYTHPYRREKRTPTG